MILINKLGFFTSTMDKYCFWRSASEGSFLYSFRLAQHYKCRSSLLLMSNCWSCLREYLSWPVSCQQHIQKLESPSLDILSSYLIPSRMSYAASTASSMTCSGSDLTYSKQLNFDWSSILEMVQSFAAAVAHSTSLLSISSWNCSNMQDIWIAVGP
jgi:hypothetical protein